MTFPQKGASSLGHTDAQKSRSARDLFHRSTIPWSRWMSTRPRLTSTPCFCEHLTHCTHELSAWVNQDELVLH
ncbi:MAG: hypothetical protein AB2693_25695 [Candidatus Thiodiazotropha sp.]